jgi:hypothetical protein
MLLHPDTTAFMESQKLPFSYKLPPREYAVRWYELV